VCSGCQNSQQKDTSLKKNSKNLPCFEYTSRNSGQLKFIKFYKDSVVWGTDSIKFNEPYGAYEMETIQPDENCIGYNVKFSKNFIIVNCMEKDILGGESLRNSGYMRILFSLKNSSSRIIRNIYSIDYKQEYVLAGSYDYTDNKAFPIVIVNFAGQYQTIEIPFNKDAPNKLTDIQWQKNKIIISYFDKNEMEINKSIMITI